MSLDVWNSLERQLGFLNDNDIAVDFFQGFQAQGRLHTSAAVTLACTHYLCSVYVLTPVRALQLDDISTYLSIHLHLFLSL